ncbi:hypothetical protein D8M23_10235 [Rothia sp. HSID18067]|nr:hypothetical protein D8M23_10235 [Rothia sp. HSID18067]
MAAAIFFVSGGPLCGGPLFFVPPGGVGVWGFGFSVGVLRACVGVFGVYTKNQSYKAPGIFTPV